MPNSKIILKKSSVAARVPTTSDLSYGELALNYEDGKLYFKTAANAITSFNTSLYIGTTLVSVNRSSASQTLTGVSIDGSSASWSTARTINLSGDVSGSVAINGTADVTLSTSIGSTTGTGNFVKASSPSLTFPAVSVSATVSAGINSQVSATALTSDFNVVTTTSNNPSGVRLPVAAIGRRVVVINKGTNPVIVYGDSTNFASIDGISASTGITLAVGAYVELLASSTTAWYSVSSSSALTTINTSVSAGTDMSSSMNALSAMYNIITSTSSDPSGVTLPLFGAGTTITVVNKGTNLLNVYAPSTVSLDGSSSAPASIPVGAIGRFTQTSSTQFYSSFYENIAHTVNATITAGTNSNLTSTVAEYGFNVITSTPNNPSGITLPKTASVGQVITILNKGTNTVNVYVPSGSMLTIDSLTSMQGFAITAGSRAEFVCVSSTKWFSYSPGGTSITYGTGVQTFLETPTSANLLAAVTDETGTGSLVFATSPTLVTPTLGVASATSINKLTITAPATSATLTIANGKTLTASNTLTFTGTDASSVAFGTGGTVAYTGGTLAQFAATTSSQLLGVISDETGSGSLVFGTSPTITTPVLSGTVSASAAIFDDLRTTVSASVTAGVNSKASATALTSVYNVITSTPNNPSGVALPTAISGKTIVIINKGTNPLSVYTVNGGSAVIDSLLTDAAFSIPVNEGAEFRATGSSQWYSNAIYSGSTANISVGYATNSNTAVNVAGTGSVTASTADFSGILKYGSSNGASVTTATSGTINLDLAIADHFITTAAGAITFTLSNIPASGRLKTFMLRLTNGGSQTITWPTGIKWPSGVAPGLTTSGIDIISFIIDDATNIRGSLIQKDSK